MRAAHLCCSLTDVPLFICSSVVSPTSPVTNSLHLHLRNHSTQSRSSRKVTCSDPFSASQRRLARISCTARDGTRVHFLSRPHTTWSRNAALAQCVGGEAGGGGSGKDGDDGRGSGPGDGGNSDNDDNFGHSSSHKCIWPDWESSRVHRNLNLFGFLELGRFFFSPTAAVAAGTDSVVGENLEDSKRVCAGVRITYEDGSLVSDKSAASAVSSLLVGKVVSKKVLDELQEELLSTGWYKSAAIRASAPHSEPESDSHLLEVILDIELVPNKLPPVKKFTCANVNPVSTGTTFLPYVAGGDGKAGDGRGCLLPPQVQAQITDWLQMGGAVGEERLDEVALHVHRWYKREGYTCAYVAGVEIQEGEMRCQVAEGLVTRVEVLSQNEKGEKVPSSFLPDYIARSIPPAIQAGGIYNVNGARQAVARLSLLPQIADVSVSPRAEEGDLGLDGALVLSVRVKERPRRGAEVDLALDYDAATGGLCPGGTVWLEDRNVDGKGQIINGSVTSENFLNPQDDLGLRAEWVRAVGNGRRNRELTVSAFNTRRVSPVFADSFDPQAEPLSVWVDRVGVKAHVKEALTRQSHWSCGLVVERATTLDENRIILTQASRMLPGGDSIPGPPTTLGPTGRDLLTFLQCHLAHDTTRFVKGTLVGQRHTVQVDQGVVVGGSRLPIFNRSRLSSTTYLPCGTPSQSGPPAVLVLHAQAGACLGVLPPHEAHPLGGPHSIRGYAVGEVAAARHYLEMATEVRVPVGGQQAYVFADFGTDLGSSEAVMGNPTRFFAKPGYGCCVGAGVRLGPSVRVEWSRECVRGQTHVAVRYGERF